MLNNDAEYVDPLDMLAELADDNKALATRLRGAHNALGTIQGLTSIQSDFGPKETMDRVEAEIRAGGLNVFARIDHAAGAAEAGLTLPPTELMIFGNARGGTPLMQSAPDSRN